MRISDWRSDVCSSDLWQENNALINSERGLTADQDYRRFGGRDYRSSSGSYPANIYSLDGCPPEPDLCFVPIEDRGNLPGLDSPVAVVPAGRDRSAERRVGKECVSTCRSRWSPYP